MVMVEAVKARCRTRFIMYFAVAFFLMLDILQARPKACRNSRLIQHL
jgi:hypothetical protein